MTSTNVDDNPDRDIVAQNSRFFETGYLGGNPPDLQRMSLAVYRLLLAGEPITPGDIAASTGLEEARISELFKLIPDSAYDCNDRTGISAFIGLSTTPANHRFEVDGRTLYTWCVFDGLFLAQVIGKDAAIATTCPATGAGIRVRLSPAAIVSASPEGVVMSLIDIDAEACRNDLRGSFCNHVNFFASEAAFRGWADGQPGHECVTLDQAHQLAVERNKTRYPDIDLGV